MTADFGAPWYLQGADLVLTMAIYGLLVRAALALLVPAGNTAWPWLRFRRLTDPLIACFAPLCPRGLPPTLTILFAAGWLMLLRVGFLLAAVSLGWMPDPSAQALPGTAGAEG